MTVDSDLNKDLGAHTEMLLDTMVVFYNEGNITGNQNRFKMACAFAMGKRP